MSIDQKLDQILEILGEHSVKLDKHDEILVNLSNNYHELSKNQQELIKNYQELSKNQQDLTEKYENLSVKYENLSEGQEGLKDNIRLLTDKFQVLQDNQLTMQSTLDEHSDILKSLIHGQEALKAEFDGFKIETAKEFGEMKKRFDTVDDSHEILNQRIWSLEKDTYRLKKIAGIV